MCVDAYYSVASWSSGVSYDFGMSLESLVYSEDDCFGGVGYCADCELGE